MPLIANAFYLLLLLLMSPWIVYRVFRYGRYRAGFYERFWGSCPIGPIGSDFAGTVWLHAVSVGEVQLLRTIVRHFELRRPDLRLVISVSTDSGIASAKEIFGDKHLVFYAPLDFSWAIRRAVSRIRPCLLVLVELEIWPNWIRQTSRLAPVVIVNARLSERSFSGYRRFRFFVSPILKQIRWIAAQDETYAIRFQQLGVEKERVCVTGSIKFDGATQDRASREIVDRRKLLRLEPDDWVWVAGSTQSPEEAIVLRAFSNLANRIPKLKLILVPRHPERFEEVAKMIDELPFSWNRRSQCNEDVGGNGWRIFLGDSIGELRWWWGLANVGFVGGSFGTRGGQNMLEPCAFGVPTSFGPNTKNFRDIVGLLLAADACKQFQTPDELEPWIERMFLNKAESDAMGQSASKIVSIHRGAIDRTWAGIEPLLPPPLQAQTNNK